MKMYTQWRQHVETWRGSGSSRADYCRRQDLNRKTFSAHLDLLPVQLEPSALVASPQLRLAHGARLELSTTVSPHWLAELLRCLA